MTKTMFILGSLASLAACGSMAAPSYQGESMGRLTGTVRSQLGEVPGDITAAIVWNTAPYDLDKTPRLPFLLSQATYGTAVDVHGTFPSTFTLDLYEPPPDVAMFDLTTNPDHPLHSASGRVFAVDPSRIAMNDDGTEDVSAALLGSSDELRDDEPYGTTQYFLYYYDNDGDPDDPYLSGITKGYHLVRMDGQLSCPMEFEHYATLDDCLAAYHNSEGYDDTEDNTYFCTHAELVGNPFIDVPLDTPLTITIAAPEYITWDYFAGVYPVDQVPDCTPP